MRFMNIKTNKISSLKAKQQDKVLAYSQVMKRIMLGMMMAILATSAVIGALSGTAYAAFPRFANGQNGININGASCTGTGSCTGSNGGTATGVNNGQDGGIVVGTLPPIT